LEDRTEMLRGSYLFAGVAEASLVPLAQASTTRSYKRNSLIFAADDDADGLHIILSGRVRIWIAEKDGRELTLAFLGAEDMFGEIALLDGLPRTANATALEATTNLFLPAPALERAMAEDAALSRGLIHSLCEILRRNVSTISSFAFVGLGARLAHVLYELALDHATISDGTARFSRRFSQSDLGLLLGVSREAVNKRFKALQNDGIVEMEDNLIVIPDLNRLRERTDSAEGGS